MKCKVYGPLGKPYTYDPGAEPVLGFHGEHRFLSNFHFHPIDLAPGLTLPSSEHAYMWFKSTDPGYRARIVYAVSPGDAKRVGYTAKLRPDWDSGYKFQCMYRVLVIKFRHPVLRRWLLATGERRLEETNNHGDRVWGRYRGVGSNHLGRILMVIRYEIREGLI